MPKDGQFLGVMCKGLVGGRGGGTPLSEEEEQKRKETSLRPFLGRDEGT